MKCLYPRQSILEKADEYDKSEFLLFLRIASRQTDVAFSLQCENLSFCDLRDLDLSDCDLTNADMSRSNLAYSRFPRADLSGANLLCSNLDMVDFTGADMNGTNIAFTSSKTACFDDLQFDLAKSSNKAYGLTIDENQKASGVFDEYPHSVMIPETDEIRNELMSNQKDAREFWDGL